MYFGRSWTPVVLFTTKLGENTVGSYFLHFLFLSLNSNIEKKNLFMWKLLLNPSKFNQNFTLENVCFSKFYVYTENYLSKEFFLVHYDYLHNEFLHPNHISAKITQTLQICDMHAKWWVRKDAWTEFFDLD